MSSMAVRVCAMDGHESLCTFTPFSTTCEQVYELWQAPVTRLVICRSSYIGTVERDAWVAMATLPPV